jgi:uncharacterized protein
MTTTHLLYLHGFRSSPQSTKARLMAEHMAREFPQVTLWLPQLPPSPAQAMAEVMEGIREWPRHTMAVVGSSLGGFYASWVAQQMGCPSVLLNPAVAPARDLERYLGEQTSWHNPEERFFFLPEYIDQLRALDLRQSAAQPLSRLPLSPLPVAPELAIIAKGDEVLDWREMTARYPHAELHLLEGGDHALSGFARHLPAVIRFLAPAQG